jgi:hypothetical protein
MVARLWGEAISGPVLAVVGIVLLVLQASIVDAPTAARVVRWGAYVTLGTAGAMFLLAQYKAWSIERERYERELAKNKMPNIRGEFFRVSLNIPAPGPGAPTQGTTVDARISACNHTEVETTLKEIRLEITGTNGTAYRLTGVQSWFETPGGTFARGIHQKLRVNGNVHGMEPDKLDPATLTVRLIDGFGNEHPLRPSSA